MFSFVLFSCGSTKININELLQSEDTTFVNTTYSEDGYIYTTCIFSKINFVGKLPLKENNDYEEISKVGGKEIDSSDFDYDKNTGHLILKNNSDEKKNYAFHIIGKYENPPVFVLHGNINGIPLVLLEGKRLENCKDFDYDYENTKIKFKSKINLDESSFAVYWFTKTRECAFGNNYDKYKEEYENLIKEWYKELE